MKISEFDMYQAFAEGWVIYGAKPRLCRFSRPHGQALASDYEAWAVVVGRARDGSEYHQKALDLIAEHNPDEREDIRRSTGY